MHPVKRYFLQNLTILLPSLDWLWHGVTLRSVFTFRGHEVEIHQRWGSRGIYELVVDGEELRLGFKHMGKATDMVADLLREPRLVLAGLAGAAAQAKAQKRTERMS
jgi:hypothetical protein